MDMNSAMLVFLDRIERNTSQLIDRDTKDSPSISEIFAELQEIKRLLARRKKFRMLVSRNSRTGMISDIELIELPSDDDEPTALTPPQRKKLLGR